ncbi:MAG TPA: aldehyde dehydrogenase family protein, partial [Micromonosporaceae bacterium]|nr:aldehyde dehydrogenase family protein [Micromonosporaceae bacterium]
MNEKRMLRNFIDGGYQEPAEGRYADLVNPATSEVFAATPVSGSEDVDRAVRAAERAFETWRDSTPAERQLAMLRIADSIEQRAEELIAVECENTGKPVSLTRSEEIPPAVDQLRFFAGAARVLEGRSAGEYLSGLTSFVRREPIGVCAQVTPWNYPFMMAVWKIGPALAAGNTIVLKPSDTTPASTLLLAEICAEHLPPGVLNVICGDRDTGRTLVSHPVPQLVAVTGSVRAGMEVASAAAKDLKRVHLELGGKAPVVVFDDVDLETAAAGIAEAGYFNAGQDCTSATRVLAGSRVHDDFVAALAEHARGTRTGAPDDDVAYGPLNNPNQLDRVTGFLNRLPDHATVAAGGHRQGDTGYFHEATVVAGLEQDDEASQEEIFGPV